MATCRECGKDVGAGSDRCPKCDRVRVPLDVKLLLVGVPFLGASVAIWETGDYSYAVAATVVVLGTAAGAFVAFVLRK